MNGEEKQMRKRELTGVVVAARTFRPGEVSTRHTHDEGQFAYATTGGISMFTDNGNWVVPARRAIWVPANIAHEMHMHGDVTMLNTFIGNGAARLAALPAHCQVYSVSALLTHLLESMLALPTGPSLRRVRLEALLLDELSGMPSLPLNVPLPEDPRLSKACRHILDLPTQTMSVDEMAKMASMSRRTFTRRFREATGLSFVAWRQQVRILEALSRLSLGASVKDVSVDLGYCSTSAFSAAFKQFLGDSPARYLSRYRDPPQVSC
ncbi:AraC family transcriptional regulator [Paraburkholderia susongensis]|uniref:Transcriptional regulator, AraC family n=1 Tax=Paraburkholderia susongensis TaxID=1515439 RepID=A0A1X7LM56_9BURK|nr:helix-turn-helix transcriptional regulator [Paraburkholderia susongensis]SMG54403.1 transcriptional regulator, AraC family [Paraburkholderia susongensis]